MNCPAKMARSVRKWRKLIRSDFWGAGIQFPATQRGARRAREFFIPRSKPLEVCFFKPFEVE